MRFRLVALLAVALGLSSVPAGAQFLSVGLKAGVPLNDAFSNDGFPGSDTKRYIIGPEVEVRLPFRLGVEFDALYRRYSVSGTSASEWQFPILLKYHFKGVPLVHPFVDGGPVFNHVSDIGFATRNLSSAGFALGAGLDFRVLLLHITPEFRYVRMADANYGYLNFNQNQNQAQFLVGFTF